jgi:flagellar motor switch protein FliG
MDSHHSDSEIPQDFSNFTSTQKLAALLLILEAENAAQIMKQFDERELEAVTAEMTKFKTISSEMQALILGEFSAVAVSAVSAVSVKVEGIQNLLEKSVGRFRASDVMCRVMPTRAPASAMQRILEMDARHIFNQLRNEQPQTIAMIASYLTPAKTAELLSLMRPELREQVVERLASMLPTSIDVVENIVEVLHRKFTSNSVRGMNQTGGARAAAQVLNALPKPMSKSIIGSLKERKPELGQAVLQKMFMFEELERMDSKILQKILQSVEMSTLTRALKNAGEKLTNKLLSCLSKRAAESVREEISFLGPLKLRDIEAAQAQIIEVVRTLENEGEIDFEEAQPAQAVS